MWRASISEIFFFFPSEWTKTNKVEAADMSESTAEHYILPCRCLGNVMEESTRKPLFALTNDETGTRTRRHPGAKREKQWENVAVFHSRARSLPLSPTFRSHSLSSGKGKAQQTHVEVFRCHTDAGKLKPTHEQHSPAFWVTGGL